MGPVFLLRYILIFTLYNADTPAGEPENQAYQPIKKSKLALPFRETRAYPKSTPLRIE